MNTFNIVSSIPKSKLVKLLLSLLFKIVNDKNLTKLNLIETYSVLTILKNLGLEDEYKQLASRILI